MLSQQTHSIGQCDPLPPLSACDNAPAESGTISKSTGQDETQAIGDTTPYPVFPEYPSTHEDPLFMESTHEDPLFMENSTSPEVDQSAFPPHSYQLIIVGRNNSQDRESVLVRLNEGLLNRLSKFASGSRSTLIELALSHIVNELESAQMEGVPVLVVEAMDIQKRLFGTLR